MSDKNSRDPGNEDDDVFDALHDTLIHRPRSALRDFVQTESAGGLVLMAAAVLALIVANSPWSAIYDNTLHAYLGAFTSPDGAFSWKGLSVSHWINDGLMAVFFLLVGLEVKREMLDGQLSTWERRILPGAAALGGMIFPALIFAYLNWDEPTLRGWAIPAATDIAFALGVLALLGKRVPGSLKIFLTAVAIIDDLGAIVIIALFYTAQLNVVALVLAFLLLGVLWFLNRKGVVTLWPYMIIGLFVWMFMLASGVHATLAGVAVAMTIPLRPNPGHPDNVESPLHKLEHGIAPWVAFLVVPIFGFANAGVNFAGMTWDMLFDPLVLGIVFGLFAGKQIGVFLTIWVLEKFDIVDYPVNASMAQVYGVALLCGIGFTMSLFIGNLAFVDAYYITEVKVGVLAGSTLSGIVGTLVLLWAKPETHEREDSAAVSPAAE